MDLEIFNVSIPSIAKVTILTRKSTFNPWIANDTLNIQGPEILNIQGFKAVYTQRSGTMKMVRKNSGKGN